MADFHAATLSMPGTEQIEAAHGAGASRTAAEAIGGTVNIVMQDPTRAGPPCVDIFP